MGEAAGMAPGANPHADIAVGAHFAPVIEAGFGIQLPPQCAVEFDWIIQRNGVRWAATGALLTYTAKIFDTDVDGTVRHKGKISGDGT